ncbi:hypothetical protein MBLNU13_g03775t1 [Cladosporium sp. NU13]
MRFVTQLLCAISVVVGKPVDPLATAQRSQRVLQNDAPERLLWHSQPVHHTSSFDAAPNSVGLLLTSAGKQRVMHVWLPLGKRIETRDSINLPSHPISARITTLIRSSPEFATPERLDEIECAVHLHVNETSAADSRWEAMFGRRKTPKKNAAKMVLFRRGDGLVRLADVESEFWLNGAEVEAYECR